MVKYKELIFIVLILFFLLFSFAPTIYELSRTNKLADPDREFILEHNYYWPDFNLYLSKIRQGWEGRNSALERYTSEPHQGSLIQEYYIALGYLGRIAGLDPNFSYQLGRLALAPLLLFVILLLVRFYFKQFFWQVAAFVTVVVSASFPRIYQSPDGVLGVGRYMEWWSNIDALQRITFIPHILFGQVVSFFLLYQLTLIKKQITRNALLFYIFLGNAVGLVFPPSLITLNGVLFLIILIKLAGSVKILGILRRGESERFAESQQFLRGLSKLVLFILTTLPSLLYLYLITKQIPWSALVEFHRTHPMMIPFTEYIKGTGPIFFLGLAGAILTIILRDKRFQPLIFWLLTTFAFAIFFTHVREQSPLRFTQTGLFIPLGILGAYFFEKLFYLSDLSNLRYLGRNLIKTTVIFLLGSFLLVNLFMMKVSLNWQTQWISQRIGANIPAVPYPPQAVYPLKAWMDGIRFLQYNTNRSDVVLGEVTAGNYIPAYAGNTVFFGQANTVDYEKKQLLVDQFFKGEMTGEEARQFLQKGNVKYIFYSIQEKELANKGFKLQDYPFLEKMYENQLVIIYRINYPSSNH